MDINEEAAHERMEEINRPDQLIFVPGNTRNREDIRNAVEETVKRFGQLDSVVANAGIHRCNTLLDISDEELDLMIQTNIYGTVNTRRCRTSSVPEEEPWSSTLRTNGSSARRIALATD